MDRGKYYRQDGYQKGFEDAKRTGGKVRQEYIDNYLNIETKDLSIAHSREFIEGWHEGFTDGVGEAIFNLAKKNEFWENHISKEF
jgi:hypothetical protein